MTIKIKTLLVLSLLIQPLIDAKCNCSRPSRPGTHNTSPVPTIPVPQQQPQPIPEYHQLPELPVQSIPEYNIPSYVPVGPQLPTVQIPEFEPETQESLNESSETVSKDEARKMALVFGGVVATVAVMSGVLFAKLNRRMDVYEAALRLLGQSFEERKITEEIKQLNERVGNLNQRLEKIADKINEKMGERQQGQGVN